MLFRSFYHLCFFVTVLTVNSIALNIKSVKLFL
nr:MAG TPA: hypothetical protein [Caudoviricetes sp.]